MRRLTSALSSSTRASWIRSVTDTRMTFVIFSNACWRRASCVPSGRLPTRMLCSKRNLESHERSVAARTTRRMACRQRRTHLLGPPPACPRESARVTAMRRFLSSCELRARAALADDCRRESDDVSVPVAARGKGTGDSADLFLELDEGGSTSVALGVESHPDVLNLSILKR